MAESAAHRVAHACVLAHPFGNDVLRSCDGLISGFHLFAVDKFFGTSHDVAFARGHDDFCQRLEASLPGGFGTGLALGLEGQIEVF